MARERWSRSDDALDALIFAIARDPERGFPLTENGQTRALTIQGALSIEFPTVTAVYEIETNQISLTAVQFIDADQAPRG